MIFLHNLTKFRCHRFTFVLVSLASWSQSNASEKCIQPRAPEVTLANVNQTRKETDLFDNVFKIIDKKQNISCTGSKIHPAYLITARHCLPIFSAEYSIQNSKTNINFSKPTVIKAPKLPKEHVTEIIRATLGEKDANRYLNRKSENSDFESIDFLIYESKLLNQAFKNSSSIKDLQLRKKINALFIQEILPLDFAVVSTRDNPDTHKQFQSLNGFNVSQTPPKEESTLSSFGYGSTDQLSLSHLKVVVGDEGLIFMSALTDPSESLRSGDSGGPIVNSDGEVVGINSMEKTYATGANLTISPAKDWILKVLMEPKKRKEI